jgi:hypothetical protein
VSTITELASASITATDQVRIELVQTDETPTVVIIHWPDKSTVLHPRRFGPAADAATRAFAGAVVQLAHIRRDRRGL